MGAGYWPFSARFVITGVVHVNEHADLDPIPTLPTPPSSSTDPAAHRRALLAGVAGLAAGALLTNRAAAGPLDPPAGPITPTGKTLTEVEPRTAINAANTPGNATSLFRITQPGSYYLTANITGVSGRSGIAVASTGVTIDLNGFALNGVPGSGSGISAEVIPSRVRVLNGTISGWGGSGVSLSAGSATSVIVENVISTNNANSGINVGENALVKNCVANFNGSIGILVTRYSVVIGCVATNNSSVGIAFNFGCLIQNCVVSGNTTVGISGVGGSTIVHCSAFSNNTHGFVLNGSGTIADCTARSNIANGFTAGDGVNIQRCSSVSNGQHGISTGSHCFIGDCSCGFNGADYAGILCNGQRSLIVGNNCTSNGTGIHVMQTSNFISRNVCSNNSTANWNISTNNKCLVVLGNNAGAINGDSGGTSPGSTNPNANFTY